MNPDATEQVSPTAKEKYKKLIIILITASLLLLLYVFVVSIRKNFPRRPATGTNILQLEPAISDFPTYPEAVITNSSKVSLGTETQFKVEWEADAKVRNVMSWYFDALINSGWLVVNPPKDALSDEAQELEGKKNDNITYTLSVSKKDKQSLANESIGEQKSLVVAELKVRNP